MKIFSTSFAICGFRQRGCCMWRNKELTPKVEDVKLITRWKHMPNMIGPYGQKFPKLAHDCRIFYAISADFDANRCKK